MIIKIDVEEGLDHIEPMHIAYILLDQSNIERGIDIKLNNLKATVTQVSRAGNIFIYVRRSP